jgi:thioredoxin reductase (NADPH)
MERLQTDIAVVGAGPIGIELAVALKRAGIEYLHFDAQQIAYTISWFAPGTRFFSSNERISIAGVPLQTADQSKATREDYLAYLRSVVEQFDLNIRTYCPIVGIRKVENEFNITCERAGQRDQCRARRVVLCTGGTHHPRKLNIPGEDLQHVSSYFRDPHMYFRKRLLVVGGKNSAVETALRCHHAGARVSLSYRREQLNPKSIKYWLLPEIIGLIQEGKIDAHFNSLPVEIGPRYVRLKELDRTIDIEADFVLLQIGYEQDTTLFELAGIELSGPCRAPVYDERTMETSVPGIYVAGTAIGGTQEKYRVFIENCHVHVDRIMAALTGATPPPAPAPIATPES